MDRAGASNHFQGVDRIMPSDCEGRFSVMALTNFSKRVFLQLQRGVGAPARLFAQFASNAELCLCTDYARVANCSNPTSAAGLNLWNSHVGSLRLPALYCSNSGARSDGD